MSKRTKNSWSDERLGMNRPITRRDFLHGLGLGATAAAVSYPYSSSFAASAADAAAAGPGNAQSAPGYYPPRLTGMRGSHPGSFEVAHALRDGVEWPEAIDTGEEYDLIVVGGGISGLSAAHFYRAKTSPQSRILILDNHDDFGGHAKRNEFTLEGRIQLLNGGTLEIDSPRPYGPIAAGLLDTLGVDVEQIAKQVEHPHFYERQGLYPGVFFDAPTFGADKLVVGLGNRPLPELLAQAPLSARARAEIAQIEAGLVDYLPGMSSDEKKQRLSRLSYEAFLRDIVQVDPAVLRFYHARTMGEWGVGTDAVSALDCWGYGMPGFQGMHLAKGSIARMGFTPAGYADTGGSARLHFPDGNATIARLLVRDLVPQALPGRDAFDIVTARADYAALDRPESTVRLRLNSIVVRAKHLGAAKVGTPVEVTYVCGGKAYKARARGVVLACYNMMIPYLCPELPEPQKAALHQLIKTPLVYTSVALRNWRAFAKLQLSSVYAPGGYHTNFYLNSHVNIGSYRSPSSPDEPILLHMVRTPCQAGLPELEQHRVGRAELLVTPFTTFERNIREQLALTLAAGGFDPAEDITAITVNRWPHGYAPEYNPLFDPELPDELRPHVIGRARFGNITIANSDSGGGAYTDVAINQGHRAVMELL
jgi:spermidine dehydrogenase